MTKKRDGGQRGPNRSAVAMGTATADDAASSGSDQQATDSDGGRKPTVEAARACGR